jgi:hypothetical protein
LHHLGAQPRCSARGDHVVEGLQRGCARPEDEGFALQVGVDHGLAPGQPAVPNLVPASSHTPAWRPQPAGWPGVPVSPANPSPSPHQQEAYQAGRPAFLDRCAARDPDGRSPATGQRPWSAPSMITMDDPVVRSRRSVTGTVMGCSLWSSRPSGQSDPGRLLIPTCAQGSAAADHSDAASGYRCSTDPERADGHRPAGGTPPPAPPVMNGTATQ